jgi:hydroxymethylbilane synthase
MPEDVLISHWKLNDIPIGSVIGTCSSRRKAYLKNILGDKLEIVDVRGTIDTRIEKFKSGRVDGLILAQAGMQRLHLEDYISEIIPEDIILPAIGQGTIAIECREDNIEVLKLLKSINHQETFTCISAERAFMLEIGGNCKTPIAALCRYHNEKNLMLKAAFAVPDGQHIFYVEESGNDPYTIGINAAQRIKQEISNSKYFEIVKELFQN